MSEHRGLGRADKESDAFYKSKGYTWFAHVAPDGYEITGIEVNVIGNRGQFEIIDVFTHPHSGSCGGSSEAAALDLASLLGPASLLASDSGQRWGRAIQVAFARVFLEASLQTCANAISFNFIFDELGK